MGHQNTTLLRQSPKACALRLTTRELTLATDLDGTFLGGSAADRTRLYGLVEELREVIGLVFVTGRSLEAIRPLVLDPDIPTPDLVIGDVGSSVAEGETLEPIAEIETQLRGGWPGVEEVRALFADLELVEQAIPQRGRVSFHVEDVALVETVRARATARGLTVVYSCGSFLDVLPPGVDKGRALDATLAHFGVAKSRVLVCGDTLNDHALYGRGARGVVVGGAERGLVDQTRGMVDVFHATSEGAGGILEALSWLSGGDDAHSTLSSSVRARLASTPSTRALDRPHVHGAPRA